jgi:hypothetical protein
MMSLLRGVFQASKRLDFGGVVEMKINQGLKVAISAEKTRVFLRAHSLPWVLGKVACSRQIKGATGGIFGVY